MNIYTDTVGKSKLKLSREYDFFGLSSNTTPLQLFGNATFDGTFLNIQNTVSSGAGGTELRVELPSFKLSDFKIVECTFFGLVSNTPIASVYDIGLGDVYGVGVATSNFVSFNGNSFGQRVNGVTATSQVMQYNIRNDATKLRNITVRIDMEQSKAYVFEDGQVLCVGTLTDLSGITVPMHFKLQIRDTSVATVKITKVRMDLYQ